MTRPAPAIGAAKANDQALAWNIGTTGIIVSRLATAIASAAQVAIAWITFERCE